MHNENPYEFILDESTGQFISRKTIQSQLKTAIDLKKDGNPDIDIDNKNFRNDGHDENIITADDPKTENDIECFKETFDVKKSVLVRYFNRKWIYYIGFVKSIRKSEENTFYTITFLKTQKKPKLHFKVPKKIDQDEVPDYSVVKLINIERDPQHNKNYILADVSDEVYFFS